MARGSAFEKKRKRDCDSTSVASGITSQTAKKRRKQVVDSDDDDGSSVFQPSSPSPSLSRRYSKPASKPSAQVASSFIAKRRGRPEEIDLGDSDEDLPSIANIIASSQSGKRSSQLIPSSSTQRQTRRSAVETPVRKGKGTTKAPYRRPTGTLVNLGTFELDEDGNDVEELKRKKEARKRRREESRRRKEGSDDDSVIECSTPASQVQKRASPAKQAHHEVIVIDSDGSEDPPLTAKRPRRSSPTPRLCSPSPPKELYPPQLDDPWLEPSFEILSHPSPSRGDPEPEAELVTYEPGELQALYDEEFQKIVDRTQSITTIVPRRKHKVFQRVPPLDPVCLNPTYTRGHNGVSAIVTALLWSRSAPSWISVNTTSSTKVRESADVRVFAEDMDSLDLSPRTGEGEEVHDNPEPEPKGDLGAREDSSQVCTQPQDAVEEQPSTAGDPDTALESLATVLPALDAPPETLASEIVPVPNGSLPRETSTTDQDSTSPTPHLRPTHLLMSTGGSLPRSLSVDSSPTVTSPPPVDLPSYTQDLLSFDDDAIIGDGIAAALERYKPLTRQNKEESLTRTVLLEIAEMLKAEHARNSESISPASSSRQSSTTLASQSSDETELSSPGPVTPVHPVRVDPVAGLSGEGGSIIALKREDDIGLFIDDDDDDTISIAGSSLELAYPD